jgi:hypothetical protein
MRDLLQQSLTASLFAQWSTLGTNVFGLVQSLSPKDLVLRSVLMIETFVQVVELAFYTWYSYHFRSVAEATFYRYHDWVITTPLMLFSTMVYYEYVNKPDEEVTIKSFLQEHWKTVLVVFAFNFMMLAFGYFYELGLLGLFSSQLFGFVGLIGSFTVIWTKFASKSPDNKWLFGFMSFVWFLYGIAAMFSSVWKNVSYNILDVIAKNFYGLFLSYLIYQKSTNKVE